MKFTSLVLVTVPLSIWSTRLVSAPSPGRLDVAVSDSVLPGLPPCAGPCYASTTADSSCPLDDQACVCKDATVLDNTMRCVASSCSVIDQLATHNATNTACGVSPRDFDSLTRILCWLGVLAAGFCVVLRLASKIFKGGLRSPSVAGLASEDFVTMAAYLFAIACYYIVLDKLLGSGFGRDQWTLSPDQITDCTFWTYVLEPIYLVSIGLIKTSFVLLFLRIFSDNQGRRYCLCGALDLRLALWGTIFANALCISSLIFTIIFMCWPIDYTWSRWRGNHEGTCININATICAHGALGIAFNLWILYLPMSQLSSMNMPLRRKLQVGAMFGVGAIAVLVSFLRLQALVVYGTSANGTRDNYAAVIWSLLELAISIICICMPAMHIVVVRFLPAVWQQITNRLQPSRRQRKACSSLPSTAATTPEVPLSPLRRNPTRPESGRSQNERHLGSPYRRPSVAACLAEHSRNSSSGCSCKAVAGTEGSSSREFRDVRHHGDAAAAPQHGHNCTVGSALPGSPGLGGGAAAGPGGRAKSPAVQSRRITPDFFIVQANIKTRRTGNGASGAGRRRGSNVRFADLSASQSQQQLLHQHQQLHSSEGFALAPLSNPVQDTPPGSPLRPAAFRGAGAAGVRPEVGEPDPAPQRRSTSPASLSADVLQGLPDDDWDADSVSDTTSEPASENRRRASLVDSRPSEGEMGNGTKGI